MSVSTDFVTIECDRSHLSTNYDMKLLPSFNLDGLDLMFLLVSSVTFIVMMGIWISNSDRNVGK